MEYKLDDVKIFSQRDNQFAASVSCFPTSMGMGVDCCLLRLGLDKSVIGCSSKMQIEDYLNQIISDSITKKWMKKNTSKFGRWIWDYKRRTIFVVEAYVFNRLMNEFGFKAKFKSISYNTFCEEIEKNNLPIIIGGNFKKVSRVRGHIVCGIGFNKKGMEEIIVNDPFGNALSGYKDKDGEGLTYKKDFFLKKGKMNAIIITQG